MNPMTLSLAFVFGIGFGFCVHRAGLCFAFGLGEVFMGKGKRIVRLFLVIVILTSIGFLLSGTWSPVLGLKPVGEIRGYGFFNLVAGLLFGAGVFICGGCILGSLRRLGEGNVMYLVVLLAMIPGMALVVYGINPILQSRYDVQKLLLSDLTGIPSVWLVAGLVVLSALILRRARPGR